MFKTLIKNISTGFCAVALVFLVGNTVHASDNHGTDTSTQPSELKVLDIIPICSDAVREISQWEVRNENNVDLTLNWNNVENNVSGTHNALAAQTTLLETAYVASDPNNRTVFSVEGFADVSRNAQVSPCVVPEVPEEPVCVDGTNKQNLITSIGVVSDLDTTVSASIRTIDGKPLCEDTIVYFSSYTMPRTYDGNGFNETATPQFIFDSKRIVLQKGTDGTTVTIINLPNRCENIQVDLYYGPEIRQVDQSGHQSCELAVNIYPSVRSCDEGGSGGTPPVDPQPPVVVPVTPPVTLPPTQGGQVLGDSTDSAVVLPATLPATGSETTTNSPLWTMFAGLVAYVAVYVAQRRFER